MTASAFCCGRCRRGRNGPTARRHGGATQGLIELEAENLASTEQMSRILLVEAALSPMRLGRQPSRADRTEAWDG